MFIGGLAHSSVSSSPGGSSGLSDPVAIDEGGTNATTYTTSQVLYYNGTRFVSAPWEIDGSGHLLATTDNTNDIGTSADNRPRNIYTSGVLVGGTNVLVRNNSGIIAIGTSDDTVLNRTAADRLALRRSTNAQRFEVYRTYTDASTWERGVIGWYDSASDNGTAGTTFRIGTEKGSVGGTARDLALIVGGVDRFYINASGNCFITAGQTFSFGGSVNASPLIYANSTQLCLRAGSSLGVQIQGTSGADGGILNFKGHASIVSESGAILGITNGSTGPGKLAIDNVQGANLERLKMEWNTNVARIGTSKGGSGTARNLVIITDDTVRVTYGASGGETKAEGHNVTLGTTTGTKIGTATGEKLGFWNATPVVQQVLATGGGATVDNVITLLQTLGLCKQS